MKCFTGWHKQILDQQEPVLRKGIEIVTEGLQYCLNQSSKIWDEMAEVWHIAVQGKQVRAERTVTSKWYACIHTYTVYVSLMRVHLAVGSLQIMTGVV